MVVGCQRSPTDARRLDHFKRHGVEHICGFPPDGDTNPGAWTVESLTKLRELCEAHGVALDMIEFPTLSSASIDARSPQHAANPQRAAGAGKGIMLGQGAGATAGDRSGLRDHPRLRARGHSGGEVTT